jgi:hypothetical protein
MQRADDFLGSRLQIGQLAPGKFLDRVRRHIRSWAWAVSTPTDELLIIRWLVGGHAEPIPGTVLDPFFQLGFVGDPLKVGWVGSGDFGELAGGEVDAGGLNVDDAYQASISRAQVHA